MDQRSLNFEVIVVGAGPAGSLAARTAAEHGVHVALLEEHPIVGQPVQCAEGLGVAGMEVSGLAPGPPVTCQKVDTIGLITPNGNIFNLTGRNADGYNLDRRVFDRMLSENAVKVGAELMVNTRALGVIEEEGVVVGIRARHSGEPLEIRAKVVIGADGHASIIRRSAGLTRYFDDYGMCAQYQLGDLDLESPNTNEIYLGQKYAPGGYAWVFPKSREVANVGLGVRKMNKQSALAQLKEFVRNDPRFKDAPILSTSGGVCPATGTLDKIVDDGLMLVGDAAGQLIPMSGSGIHSGMVAGRMAGEVAARAVGDDDVSASRLGEYSDAFNREWGKKIRDSSRMIGVIERLTDDELDTLSETITQEDIMNLVGGEAVTRTLARMVLRAPQLSLKLISKMR